MTLIDFLLPLCVLNNYWFWACFIGVMSQLPMFSLLNHICILCWNPHIITDYEFLNKTFFLIMTHFEINVQNLLYKSSETYHFIMYYLFDPNSVVIISKERRVCTYNTVVCTYNTLCCTYNTLMHFLFYQNLFNTNQEIYIWNIYK